MKNSVLTAIIAIGLATAVTSTPASAQVTQKATIPFSFVAGGVEYPEGNYLLERHDRVPVVKLTNLTSSRAVFVGGAIPLGNATHRSSKLVFSTHGDSMKLDEVWFPGHPGMATSPPPKDISARVTVPMK